MQQIIVYSNLYPFKIFCTGESLDRLLESVRVAVESFIEEREKGLRFRQISIWVSGIPYYLNNKLIEWNLVILSKGQWDWRVEARPDEVRDYSYGMEDIMTEWYMELVKAFSRIEFLNESKK